MRLGSGALVAGWSASVVKDEGQQGYTFAKFGGNRLKETSKVPAGLTWLKGSSAVAEKTKGNRERQGGGLKGEGDKERWLRFWAW